MQIMIDIKGVLLQWSINFFEKKYSATRANKFAESGTNENISNQELAEELRKTIIKKIKKRKVQSPFIDNIWNADFANMQFLSKFN